MIFNTSYVSAQDAELEKDKHKPSIDSKSIDSKKDLCDKRLLKGIIYSRFDENGKETKFRIRFAPYKLHQHTNPFFKFRDQHEKLYGGVHGARAYERLVCNYFFGAYSFAELPEGVEELNILLKDCPLKVLNDLILADGPRPDCAPGVVHCHRSPEPPLKHPFDKISCLREIPHKP
jgi:hypothetical protein